MEFVWSLFLFCFVPKNSPDGFHRMTAEKRPAFCSDVQQLSSGLGAGFRRAVFAAVSVPCISAACGVSMSMASSSRLGVAAACAALLRPLFLGGIAAVFRCRVPIGFPSS